MAQRRTIGEVLVGLGRISEADVEKALEHQRRSGGYFGEALVACGLIKEDELEFGLASQFDLPYVFVQADQVDYEAAALVTPEWALTNLTLPIVRTATSLTVVVESPLKTKAVEELRARTQLDIELAISSGSKIRELIRQVFARASAADQETPRHPVSLPDALDLALAASARRFGVSIRGAHTMFWWDEGGTIRRRPISGHWESELEGVLRPSLAAMTAGQARRDWAGELARGGVVAAVDAHFLADESGKEYLFHARPITASVRDVHQPPPAGILSEVRLLARSGNARFVFSAAPAELGCDILPHLPELLLDPSWRSICLHSRDRSGSTEVFSYRLSEDRTKWRSEIDALLPFQFDAVAVDLVGTEGDWAQIVLGLGSVAFLHWSDAADFRRAYEAGIRWHLHVSSRAEGQLDWALQPLQA